MEEYRLTQTIAACILKIGYLNSDCVKNDPDATNHMKDLAWGNYFTLQGECKEYADGMSENDGLCYHTNMNAAFNS